MWGVAGRLFLENQSIKLPQCSQMHVKVINLLEWVFAVMKILAQWNVIASFMIKV